MTTMGLGALMIPESPRYLVARHRDEKARAVLRSIIGSAAEAKVENQPLDAGLQGAG